MPKHARSSPTPWLAFFLALLGLVWCGFIAFPTANPAPCVTSGCALFRDSTFAGLSLWWVGGAFFFVLAILCLRGERVLARHLALTALYLDALLLVVMFFTAPCFDCLVVAALIGLCYYTLKPSNSGWFLGGASSSVMLPIWFGLFLGNCIVAIDEQAPHHVLGNTDATEISLFFSPSCPACREALLSLGDKAALYPVEEKEGDFDAILRLESLLMQGVAMEDALQRSLNPETPVPHISMPRRCALTVQLLRNKATVLKQGYRALPLILINGMPGYHGSPVPPETPSGFSRVPLPDGQRVPAPPAGNGYGNGDAGENLPGAQIPAEQIRPDPFAPPPGSYGPQNRPRAGANNAGGGELPDFIHNLDRIGQCGQGSSTPCD